MEVAEHLWHCTRILHSLNRCYLFVAVTTTVRQCTFLCLTSHQLAKELFQLCAQNKNVLFLATPSHYMKHNGTHPCHYYFIEKKSAMLLLNCLNIFHWIAIRQVGRTAILCIRAINFRTQSRTSNITENCGHVSSWALWTKTEQWTLTRDATNIRSWTTVDLQVHCLSDYMLVALGDWVDLQVHCLSDCMLVALGDCVLHLDNLEQRWSLSGRWWLPPAPVGDLSGVLVPILRRSVKDNSNKLFMALSTLLCVGSYGAQVLG